MTLIPSAGKAMLIVHQTLLSSGQKRAKCENFFHSHHLKAV